MDPLIEVNNQCHEHLRESNRKKDAMLGLIIFQIHEIQFNNTLH